MKWIPPWFRPSYWRDYWVTRWHGFATADLPAPHMSIAAPDATDTEIASVLGPRGTLTRAEITLWASTWLIQLGLIAMTALQVTTLLSQLNTSMEQCQTGRCGASSPVELSALWVLVLAALVVLSSWVRGRLEDQLGHLTSRRARSARSAAPRVIAVDDLDGASRWLLRRAAGLLRAYPALEDGALWLLAARADAASRLPLPQYQEQCEQLLGANDRTLADLETAHAARGPFRLDLSGAVPERVDVQRPQTIHALTRSTGEVPAP